ncbi:MAG: hypothetical protein EOO77_37475 [Oxalobacteraceae bacterium]|nr:MAG: hypothetical protein EOO77_37475 [Oxalobacteraceae bacterium]
MRKAAWQGDLLGIFKTSAAPQILSPFSVCNGFMSSVCMDVEPRLSPLLRGETYGMAKHQQVAMSLLTAGVLLKPREGQFLGGVAFDANPLTDKQRSWLMILLDRHGLPPLADGGDA